MSMKFYFLKSKSIQEIRVKLDKLYGESAPLIITENKCFKNVRRGHMSRSDTKRFGHFSRKSIILMKLREITSVVGVYFATTFE